MNDLDSILRTKASWQPLKSVAIDSCCSIIHKQRKTCTV
jgi:hypothetical protein